MNFLTGVYLFYMFLALYFLLLFTITFIQNRKEMFSVLPVTKHYSLSVVIPAHNEEDSLRGTVESVLESDYDNIVEVIIATNACTDNTVKIAKDLAKKYKKVRVINSSVPSKANVLNEVIKVAGGELFAVVDADSYPDRSAVSSMVGFFEDKAVGAVTTRVQVRDKDNFIRRMQSIEYKTIAFSRKLLGFLDSIYVTPGPLAMYRKSALIHIGGFDVKNMTEDIEATWHLVKEGYKIRMSFISKVTTVAPDTVKKWFKQRIRWNIGGFQTILKYKSMLFRKNMLGYFILPFFAFSLILGVVGLSIFLYRLSLRFITSYLSTKYSMAAETAVLRFNDINLNPSILNFFGVVLFLLGLAFVYYALMIVNRQTKEKDGILDELFYSIVYITIYPIILITSLYKFIKGGYTWR